MSLSHILLAYLIVGEATVALLVTFSRKFCRRLKNYPLSEAVLSCGYCVAVWPYLIQKALMR